MEIYFHWVKSTLLVNGQCHVISFYQIVNDISHLQLIFVCHLVFFEHPSAVNTRWAHPFKSYQWLAPKQWLLPGMWWILWRRTRCAALRPPKLSAPWPSSRGPHSSTPQGGVTVVLCIPKRGKKNKQKWHEVCFSAKQLNGTQLSCHEKENDSGSTIHFVLKFGKKLPMEIYRQ